MAYIHIVNKARDLVEFKKYLTELLSEKIFSESYTTGSSTIDSILGGCDITYNAQNALQNMMYILEDSPELIKLVPKKWHWLVIEYSNQNYMTITKTLENELKK